MNHSFRLVSVAVAVAVVAFILGVLATLWTTQYLLDRQRTAFDPKNVKKRLVQEYTIQELKRLGIDCRELRSDVSQFLKLEVQPVISAYRAKNDWKPLLHEDTRNKTEAMRNKIFDCSRLYSLGEEGRLNDLENIKFVEGLIGPFSRLTRFFVYELTPACDQSCAEKGFTELEDIQNTITKIVKNELA